MDDVTFDTILKAFVPDAADAHVSRYGAGHIHDTYKVSLVGGGATYILQRINHRIFTDVPALMANVMTVTEHQQSRKKEHNGLDVLRVLSTAAGALYHVDSEGRFWRLFERVTHAHSVDVAESCEQIYQAGRAYGLFLRQCDDLAVTRLNTIIPGFHDGQQRMTLFRRMIAECSQAAEHYKGEQPTTAKAQGNHGQYQQ